MNRTIIAIGVALTCVASSAAALAGDDDLTLDDLPPVVRATVEREVGSGTIDDIEWESGPREPHYEVEYVLAGQDWELKVAEDGRVIAKKLD